VITITAIENLLTEISWNH